MPHADQHTADIEYLKAKARRLEMELNSLKLEVDRMFQDFLTYKVNHP